MKKAPPVKLLVFSLLFGAALNAHAQGQSSSTLNSELPQYKISLGESGSDPVISNYKFRVKDMIFHILAGETASRRIEFEIIRNISPETASRYIESRYAVVRDLYNPKSIPYGGAITRDTQCPEGMKPEELAVKVLDKPVQVLLVNASRRYALGVWDKSAAYKKAGFLIFHDEPNRTLFQMIIFTDFKDFDSGKLTKILADIKKTEPAE